MENHTKISQKFLFAKIFRKIIPKKDNISKYCYKYKFCVNA